MALKLGNRDAAITQLKKGALELCILEVLAQGVDRYGYELVKLVSQTISVTEGTIYPLLKRLKDNGLIESHLEDSTSGGPARKYYKLTHAGMEEKKCQENDWLDFQKAMNHLIHSNQKGDNNEC
ncbi:MAG: PadR family transcriptional regulator [Bifidobacteriaceae bacterium]|jgi:PadR family transcriptional regulator PadR|nr:PadR family transcriptional regulator [Bifidobacteriaceae bacterium]